MVYFGLLAEMILNGFDDEEILSRIPVEILDVQCRPMLAVKSHAEYKKGLYVKEVDDEVATIIEDMDKKIEKEMKLKVFEKESVGKIVYDILVKERNISNLPKPSMIFTKMKLDEEWIDIYSPQEIEEIDLASIETKSLLKKNMEKYGITFDENCKNFTT